MSFEIPIVDFSAVLAAATGSNGLISSADSNPKLASTIEEIDKAMSTVGFMYLVNHGVSADIVDDAFKKTRKFFDLPTETKLRYRKHFTTGKSDGHDYNGYSGPGEELFEGSLHEVRETFDMMGTAGLRIFPAHEHVPYFRICMENLEKSFVNLSRKLNQVLALALGLEDVNYFNDRALALTDLSVPALNDLRVINYPSVKGEVVARGNVVRCAEHSDYGQFTLLLQDQMGGLEVKRVDGTWIPVKPLPGAILVNTGDLLQIWSAGHFPATPHRVQFPNMEKGAENGPSSAGADDSLGAAAAAATTIIPPRLSIAFFVGPDDAVNISPLSTKFSPEVKAAGPTFNAYEYMMGRARNAYGINK